MALDLSGLSSGMTQAAGIGDLILVTPNKNLGYRAQSEDNTTLEASILFSYEGENTATLTSDITDYAVEDNTSIADHIALKPEVITVRGFIGELSSVIEGTSDKAILAKEKLIAIAGYQPELTISGLRAYNLAEQSFSVADSIKKTIMSTLDAAYGNDPTTIGSDGIETGKAKSQTLQQIYFQKFYTYWRNRRLFTIQTPWAIFKNMAIQNLRAIQEEGTDKITDFEISFKMIRFAKTRFEAAPKESRLSEQAASNVDHGGTTGNPVSSPIPGIIP
jgi:hypothetical protein